MFDRDIWYELLQNFRRNPLRTALTACGIFWGIFILVVMLGFGNGIESGVKDSMSGYATNAIYIWGEKTTVAHDGLVPGRPINLTNADTRAIENRMSSIATLAPRVEHPSGRINATRDINTTEAIVSGDVSEYRDILPMTILNGRFLNTLDNNQARRVAVIGERIHRDLFNNREDVIGSEIALNNSTFTVVGIFKPVRYGSDREEMERYIFTPLSTFQQVFSVGPRISYYSIIPEHGITSSDVGSQVIKVLKHRHRVSPEDELAIESWNTQQQYQKILTLFTGIRSFIWIVGLATLLAGVLGVTNIMIISIRERRREFGVRKSIGATPGSVLHMILLETSTFILFSGLAGLLAALAALRAIDLFINLASSDHVGNSFFGTPSVDIKVALGSLIALILASIIATLIPARHAMNIDPVLALRSE